MNYVEFKNLDIDEFDTVIVGCGFAGATIAKKLSDANKKVLIIEKRNHIAGNMYDYYNSDGILIHKYGPHIFHTNIYRVYEFIKANTEVIPYEHRVKANIYDTYMPIPFNKTSMGIAFGKERANFLTNKLIKKFGDEVKVTINELKAQNDKDLLEIAKYVYENIFLYYTQKQWGVTPEEVDPSVTGRVPIFISRDDRYFQDQFQVMPKYGYTKLFKNLLDSKNIKVALNTEAQSVFGLNFCGNDQSDKLEYITIKYKRFDKPIIFTGPLDELFLWQFGRLPYRSLDFKFETFDKEYIQPCGTINYTVDKDYTRITEYKHLTGQIANNTTIMKEFSRPYEDVSTQTPYYAIINEENINHYKKYKKLVENVPNFFPIGRLAEYKYYNMDQIIDKALSLSDKILNSTLEK